MAIIEFQKSIQSALSLLTESLPMCPGLQECHHIPAQYRVGIASLHDNNSGQSQRCNPFSDFSDPFRAYLDRAEWILGIDIHTGGDHQGFGFIAADKT